MKNTNQFIYPNWPAPQKVGALTTTRQGGYSQPPFDGFNLAYHVNDKPKDVDKNRQLLHQQLPTEAKWLQQTHTNHIVELNHDTVIDGPCDASFTTESGVVCTVMTADCLPLLLTDNEGRFVAAIHCGWRGLAKCIIAASLAAIRLKLPDIQAKEIIAWLGPAIGPKQFEVGAEVKTQLLNSLYSEPSDMNAYFVASNNSQKYFCNIYQLAKRQLAQLGVEQIYGGEYCTFSDEQQFFSYRRDGETGRMASCIWLES